MGTRGLRSSLLAGAITVAFVFTANAEPRTYQTVNMFQFMNPTVLKPGGATLYRSKQSVELRLAAGGLDLNSSYSVWWVVFNNPTACSPPGCAGKDLGNPAVRAAVFYAAGFVTGLGDTANISAHLETGALPEGIDVEQGSGLESGNGFGAEIHVIVRSHGATLVGSVNHQIGSFNGACNPVCANKQAAVFAPVQ